MYYYTVLKTDKHERLVNRQQNSNLKKQQLFTASSSSDNKKSTFSKDLCKAILCANIPLYKLTNIEFWSFLEKYTLHDIPTESTLRKTYVDDCYNETMDNFRKSITVKKNWVSIDETTDVEGRFIANVIVGTLLVDGPGEIFLLTFEVLEKGNFSTIAKLFDKSIFLLWPDGIQHNNVLLFLSDAAPYIIKAGTILKVFYSKMVHVTCLAHAMHKIAEEISSKFPEVDKLISRVKQVFLKASSRTIKNF